MNGSDKASPYQGFYSSLRSVRMLHAQSVGVRMEDVVHDFIQSHPVLHLGHDERPVAPHLLRVAGHHLQIGSHRRREIGLIDHERLTPPIVQR